MASEGLEMKKIEKYILQKLIIPFGKSCLVARKPDGVAHTTVLDLDFSTKSHIYQFWPSFAPVSSKSGLLADFTNIQMFGDL